MKKVGDFSSSIIMNPERLRGYLVTTTDLRGRRSTSLPGPPPAMTQEERSASLPHSPGLQHRDTPHIEKLKLMQNSSSGSDEHRPTNPTSSKRGEVYVWRLYAPSGKNDDFTRLVGKMTTLRAWWEKWRLSQPEGARFSPLAQETLIFCIYPFRPIYIYSQNDILGRKELYFPHESRNAWELIYWADYACDETRVCSRRCFFSYDDKV